MHYIYIYVCVCVCDEFETASALARHMATHPKEKPFLFFEIPVHWGNIWEWSTKAKTLSSLHTAMEYSVGPSTWKGIHALRQWEYTIQIRKAIDLCSMRGQISFKLRHMEKHSGAHAGEKPINPETAYEAWHWEKAVLLYRMHCCFQTGQSIENAHEKSHRWKKALCLHVHSESAWFAFSSMEPFEGLFKNTYCGKTGKTILMQRMWWFFSNVFFVIFSCKSGVQVTG